MFVCTETGARNERRLCAVHCGRAAGFQFVHGLLDRVMALLREPWDKDTGYYLRQCEGWYTFTTNNVTEG